MNPFRLVILAGCTVAVLGAGYMSFYGIGRASGELTAVPPGTTQSTRTGSTRGGGYGFFGRVK